MLILCQISAGLVTLVAPLVMQVFVVWALPLAHVCGHSTCSHAWFLLFADLQVMSHLRTHTCGLAFSPWSTATAQLSELWAVQQRLLAIMLTLLVVLYT